MTTYHEYEKLCQTIWEHNRRYYVEHDPLISDEEFDHLLKKLEEIEKAHPEWISASSPTQRVNESLTEGFKTIKHRIPMLSLANTYSKEELGDFLKRIIKFSGKTDLAFSCELKMDGIAVSVRYEKGIYVQGVTRGNGVEGDEITANLKTIETLPLRIYGDNVPEILELRGEVFMTHDVFEKMNWQREKEGEPLWANPRNAAAGSLKLLDPREAARRKLSIVFYGVAEDSSGRLKCQFESHAFLKELGFPTLKYIERCTSLEEIEQYIEKVFKARSTLPYDIDGIVLKLDDLQEQKRLGFTGKTPLGGGL